MSKWTDECSAVAHATSMPGHQTGMWFFALFFLLPWISNTHLLMYMQFCVVLTCAGTRSN
ncbi:hypothetical protein AALO_G00024060 [Alosa alosa]|uniref:Uncharacterized protein n=1 Tax=Alosa alosa TaxID=278164 RepID=A0AAV6HAG7_9TELE|nr:hypothetical protein AALO_G00024060 [Alosa alosa]